MQPESWFPADPGEIQNPAACRQSILRVREDKVPAAGQSFRSERSCPRPSGREDWAEWFVARAGAGRTPARPTPWLRPREKGTDERIDDGCVKGLHGRHQHSRISWVGFARGRKSHYE